MNLLLLNENKRTGKMARICIGIRVVIRGAIFPFNVSVILIRSLGSKTAIDFVNARYGAKYMPAEKTARIILISKKIFSFTTFSPLIFNLDAPAIFV
ncbi:hypothetical protein JCM10914A_45760 [Paenibacillus sp. JCM 10914]